MDSGAKAWEHVGKGVFLEIAVRKLGLMPSVSVTDSVKEAGVHSRILGDNMTDTGWRRSTTSVNKMAGQRIVAFTSWLNAGKICCHRSLADPPYEERMEKTQERTVTRPQRNEARILAREASAVEDKKKLTVLTALQRRRRRCLTGKGVVTTVFKQHVDVELLEGLCARSHHAVHRFVEDQSSACTPEARERRERARGQGSTF